MKLKTSANAARERIAQMIVSGNILLEKVTAEYSVAKKAGTFDEKNDIPGWKEQQVDWLHRCLAVLQDIFPTPAEAIRLKNAQASAPYQSGVNAKWSGLTNDIKAKVSALDDVDKSIAKYSVEMAVWNYLQIMCKRTSRKSSEKVSRQPTRENRVTPSLRTSRWGEIG
jgi:hypothetical protein